jgi:COPI associated protein
MTLFYEHNNLYIKEYETKQLMTMTEQTQPLVSAEAAAAAASYGTAFVSDAITKVQKAQREGPLTFRMLGFLGGVAMTISNSLAILDRFFSFNFTGALLAIYGVFFGILITALEGSIPFSQQLNTTIRYYAKFLDFTWGRGALYFFVGSLQASNWNMLDWAVGGFMIFVGVTAMGVGIATAAQLKEMKNKLATEGKLREKWDQFDTNKDGFLDVKEVTALVRSFDMNLSRNEIAATFLALGTDKFDSRFLMVFSDSSSLIHVFHLLCEMM